jgi:hypothetical protein
MPFEIAYNAESSISAENEWTPYVPAEFFE